jgi:hypothetical protein
MELEDTGLELPADGEAAAGEEAAAGDDKSADDNAATEPVEAIVEDLKEEVEEVVEAGEKQE